MLKIGREHNCPKEHRVFLDAPSLLTEVGVGFDVRINPRILCSIRSWWILLGLLTLDLIVHPICAGNIDSPKSSAAEITKWRKEAEEANELWLKQDADHGIPKFENLLGHTELLFGKDSPEVGIVVCPIGFLYCKRGDIERGLPYLERSLKLLSPLSDNAQNLGLNADLYRRLANSYGALLQPDSEDPNLVALLIEIGSLHSLQGRQLDAIPLLERALAISEKKFGTESTETATALASLGFIRALAGQFEPALASLKRSLQIREKNLSTTHLDLGIATWTLG